MPEKRKCPEKRFMYYRLLVRVLLRIAGVRGMVLPHGMAGRCSRDRSRMNRAEAFVAACELLTLHGFKRAVVTPEHLAVYFGGADRKGEDNVYALLLHLLRAEGVALAPEATGPNVMAAVDRRRSHAHKFEARGFDLLNLAAWPTPTVAVAAPDLVAATEPAATAEAAEAAEAAEEGIPSGGGMDPSAGEGEGEGEGEPRTNDIEDLLLCLSSAAPPLPKGYWVDCLKLSLGRPGQHKRETS